MIAPTRSGHFSVDRPPKWFLVLPSLGTRIRGACTAGHPPCHGLVLSLRDLTCNLQVVGSIPNMRDRFFCPDRKSKSALKSSGHGHSRSRMWFMHSKSVATLGCVMSAGNL